MIRAIIFDLDGVLVDAVEWHFLALNKALSLFGYSITQKENQEIYNGLPTTTKLEMLSQTHALPKQLHSFINEMKQKYTENILQSHCSPEMRVSGMLRQLKTMGYSIGVASNSTRGTVNKVLERMSIREYFDVVLSRDDVNDPKPSDEIFNRCFTLLRVKPEECLIIEDSKPGIAAAEKTGAEILKVSGPGEVTLERVLRETTQVAGTKRTSVSNHPARPSEIEIVIPMAGLGQRFSIAGFTKPKPLIDVIDKPMIQWVVENIKPKNYRAHFTFICNEEHLKNLQVENLLNSIAPGCTIISARGVTEGAACTVLLATEQLNHARPLLLANSDQWVNVSIDAFLDDAFKKQADGSIMTFTSNEKKWSYAKLNTENRVVEVAEKRAISNHATVGIYFFKHANDFVKAAEDMIRKDIRTNGEFYVCPVYNELVALQKDIKIYEIPVTSMHGLGTPEDLSAFLELNAAA